MSHESGRADMVVVLTERCNRGQETEFRVTRWLVDAVRLLAGGTLGAQELWRETQECVSPPIYQNLL